jgi:osmotically-inducible protein OsmY
MTPGAVAPAAVVAAPAGPDDSAVADAAGRALAWHPAIPLGAVRVAVKDGRVTLRGSLTWLYERRAAEAAVRSLPGVRSVTNEIQVKRAVTAEDIKARIADAFKRTAEINASRVTVETLEGRVILTGSVRSAEERREAERVALASPGVSVVDDRLVVRP